MAKAAFGLVLILLGAFAASANSHEQEIFHLKSRIKIDSLIIVRLKSEVNHDLEVKSDSVAKLKQTVTEKTTEVNKLKLEISELKRHSFKDGEFYRSKDFFGILAIILTLVAFGTSFLISMLKERNKANNKLQDQNEVIRNNAFALDQKNKEIIDSIQYARRIQEASMLSAKEIKEIAPKSFVFYQPKDIISGDFFWMTEKYNKLFVATADCTGHGVPGALLSVFGVSHLKDIVDKKGVTTPKDVLTELRDAVIANLNKTASGETIQDGMDMSFYVIDKLSKKLTFAGANNGLFIVRKGEVLELKPNKQPVGYGPMSSRPFDQQTIQLESGDLVVSYTDGYADQFGGTNGKKFKTKNFKDLLVKISNIPEPSAGLKLKQTFNSWRGKLEQIDDVCIIGVRV
jgi:serine phosphatase RsbU (regulator of sigma subunit)